MLRAFSVVLVVMLSLACSAASFADALSPEEAAATGTEAYVYGYPLVTMEMTRRVMTNVIEPSGTRVPMGHLARLREYPSAAFRDVTAPNADTLYTSAWIDVGKEPWVLSLPDAKDRYYLFPMLDGFTNVFEVPGKRTTGTGPQTYAITGPGWKGTLPEGVKEYRSPTALVWLLGRIYCTGTPEDYEAVHQLQDQVSLAPLSSYGKAYTPTAGKVDPAIDMKTPVRDQVNGLSTAEYFSLLAKLLKNNPPAKGDAAMVEKMATLGIEPGQPFAFDQLAPEVQKALETVPDKGIEKIKAHFKGAGEFINGWLFTTKTGQYGTDYLQRATIAYFGLGANWPQDAIYPTSETNEKGEPYSGENNYVLHFPKGKTPPVKGFWSLTMYDSDYFFVENPLNRYTLSARDELKTNEDGSIDLYIQHENPGPERESNWLPAPAGKFVLMMRLYWPETDSPSILNGTWQPPAVKKVE